MKIKLLKDHTLGKAGDEVDIPQGRANYLMRMGVAQLIENDPTSDVIDSFYDEKVTQSDVIGKEKKEFIPEPEKHVHTSIPTAKKRGRKPKAQGL